MTENSDHRKPAGLNPDRTLLAEYLRYVLPELTRTSHTSATLVMMAILALNEEGTSASAETGDLKIN